MIFDLLRNKISFQNFINIKSNKASLIVYSLFLGLFTIIAVYIPQFIAALILITSLPIIYIRKPEWILVLIFFFLILVTQPTNPTISTGYIKVQDLLIIFLTIFWLIDILFEKRNVYFDRSNLTISLSGFILVGILGLFIGVFSSNSSLQIFYDVREYFYLILYWIVIDKIKTIKQIQSILISLIIIINIFALTSIFMTLFNVGFVNSTEELRFVKATTVYLPIGILLIISFLIYESKLKNKLYYILALIFPFSALILSYTRGHWIATIIGVIWIFVFSKKENKIKNLFSIAFVAIASLLIYAYLFKFEIHSVVGGIQERGSSASELGISIALRLQEMLLIIKQLPDNLFFGNGLGATLFMFRPFRGWVHWWDIHNNYFEFLYEIGLIGLLAYFYWAISIFHRCHIEYKKSFNSFSRALILGFSGIYIYLITISLSSGFIFRIDTIPFIVTMLGFIVIINNIENNGNQTDTI